MKKIDLDKLPPDVRARVQREINPRNTVMSVRVPKAMLGAWKKSADDAGMYFVDWVTMACEALEGKGVRKK